MTTKSNSNALKVFPRRHLLTCEGLSANEINFLLDLADKAADAQPVKRARSATCCAGAR